MGRSKQQHRGQQHRRRRVLLTAGILFAAVALVYLLFIARGIINYYA